MERPDRCSENPPNAGMEDELWATDCSMLMLLYGAAGPGVKKTGGKAEVARLVEEGGTSENAPGSVGVGAGGTGRGGRSAEVVPLSAGTTKDCAGGKVDAIDTVDGAAVD